MNVYTFGMIFMPILYIGCNIYVHKKRIESRWIYTIYSTVWLIIYILIASISHKLFG